MTGWSQFGAAVCAILAVAIAGAAGMPAFAPETVQTPIGDQSTNNLRYDSVEKSSAPEPEQPEAPTTETTTPQAPLRKPEDNVETVIEPASEPEPVQSEPPEAAGTPEEAGPEPEAQPAAADVENEPEPAPSSELGSAKEPETESEPGSGPEPEPLRRYQDGTFTGTGEGYYGMITVSVTISEDVITSISVDSCIDDDDYFGDAQDGVVPAILSAQSPDVSAVSGATYSSKGIMAAVRDALSKAEIQ